ncbi:Serine/threonine-protein phosphatase 6 regulatory ankyrin repeat subunit A [Thelohanellus kitauei]|uniref:Serine/threonine-protein phosphatase 6 regulatory ankyrin repeat subunit A n=1 Tax=Thelohanellus kitauei TaxID=669202 RepID=A0A0C2MP60_THEKT|nr:Serine/threonine-protein phosphatase 6 regulatory ankyrin repeat subunit A [Thelohanellus kitauei]
MDGLIRSLAGQISCNLKMDAGNKILLEGCLNNNFDRVEERLSSGDDPNEFVNTANLSVPGFNTGDIARLLISKGLSLTFTGAKVNIKDKDWMTPLHYASMSGSTALVQLLLSHGADCNARDKLWRTPYHIAAAVGNYNLFELIISRLKILNIADRKGWNSLHYAAFYGHNEVFYRCSSGHIEVMSILQSSGADINCKDKKISQSSLDGNIPFHFCCLNGDSELIEFFAQRMTNLIHPNKEGQIFAHLLCFSKVDPHLFNRYVTDEVLNYKDKKGRSVIHYLAINNNYSILQWIDEKRININAQDKEGWTALHFACYQQAVEIVINLVNMGANINW